jgi:hypothetical protein
MAKAGPDPGRAGAEEPDRLLSLQCHFSAWLANEHTATERHTASKRRAKKRYACFRDVRKWSR